MNALLRVGLSGGLNLSLLTDTCNEVQHNFWQQASLPLHAENTFSLLVTGEKIEWAKRDACLLRI